MEITSGNRDQPALLHRTPPKWDRVDAAVLAAIVLTAAVLRIAYVLKLRACPFFEHEIMDALYHDQWARAILEGRPFVEGAYFRAPLYPWFLATVYRLSDGSYLAARVVQALVGSLSSGLVFVLGRLMFSRTVGAVAGFVAATYWVLIAFDAELLFTVLLVFFDLGMLIALEMGRRSDRLAWWLAAGVLMGLSAITWPLVLLFSPAAALWVLWIYRARWRRGLLAAGTLACGCLAAVLPVTLQNWRSGDPVLIATQGGVNFYIGNNPQSDGFTAIVPGTRPDWWGGYYDAIARAEAAAGRKLKGSEVSDYYYGEACAFMREQPAEWLKLMGRKLAYFWSWHEIPNNKDDQFIAERYAPFVRYLPLGFWIVGPLGALGLVLALRTARLFPLWGFVLISMLGVVLFFVTGRYRLPAVPPLILLATYAAAWLLSAVRARRYRALAAAAAFVAAVAVPVSRTPAGSRMHPAEMLISMGRVLVESGRTAEALPYFEEAIQREPDNPRAVYAMGVVRQSAGALDEAAGLYRRAIELRPDYAEAHNNLGGLLYKRRDFAAALAHFESAIAAEPAHAGAHLNRARALDALGRTDEALAAYKRGRELQQLRARSSVKP